MVFVVLIRVLGEGFVDQVKVVENELFRYEMGLGVGGIFGKGKSKFKSIKAGGCLAFFRNRQEVSKFRVEGVGGGGLREE